MYTNSVQLFHKYDIFEEYICIIAMFILIQIPLETIGTVYIIESANRNNNSVVFYNYVCIRQYEPFSIQ